MATFRALSREDGNLTSSLLNSRSKPYIDIDLLFEAKPDNGDIYKKKDVAAVKQAIKTLLLTNKYERPFSPLFGSDITKYLFELAYDETEDEIRDDIINAIEVYEPRAEVIDVLVNVLPDQNSISVTVEFKVISTDEISSLTTTLSRLR